MRFTEATRVGIEGEPEVEAEGPTLPVEACVGTMEAEFPPVGTTLIDDVAEAPPSGRERTSDTATVYTPPEALSTVRRMTRIANPASVGTVPVNNPVLSSKIAHELVVVGM